MVSRIKFVVPFIMPLTRRIGSWAAVRSKLVSHGMPPPAAAVQRSATPFSFASVTSSR